jgi:hypothetical protein
VNSLTLQFKATLLELEKIYETAMSQDDDKAKYEIVIATNDSLIVRVGMNYWACPLSSKECNFIEALLQNGWKMGGNNVGKWIDTPSDQSIRNFLKPINRKLRVKQTPVRLHFTAWEIAIEVR